MDWKKDSILAFDTETTGTGQDAKIVEISFVHFLDGKIKREESFLLWPEGVDWQADYVRDALRVNGLTQAELRGKPTFKELFTQLMDIMAEAPTWVAHNALFDLRMIKQERVRLQDPGTDKFVPRPELVLDALALDFMVDRGKKKRNLEATAKRYGIEQHGAHRALDDAMVCGEILFAMMPKLPEDIGELRELQGKGQRAWHAICEGAKRRDAKKREAAKG